MAAAAFRGAVMKGLICGLPITLSVTSNADPDRNVRPYASAIPFRAGADEQPDFVWPLAGKVISGFGAPVMGGRNDGMNIVAAAGTPIRASATGSVTYAGDELKDYGNMVLIKHSGGFITVYGHAARLVVSRGDVVTRGQVIGYVGQTGDVKIPQLHFELRRGTVPVNPSLYLATLHSR